MDNTEVSLTGVFCGGAAVVAGCPWVVAIHQVAIVQLGQTELEVFVGKGQDLRLVLKE